MSYTSKTLREVSGHDADGNLVFTGRAIRLAPKARFMANPICPGTIKVLARSGGKLVWLVVEARS